MASGPVDQLAAESAAARAKLSATFDEIQDRLDPRKIVGDAVGRVAGNGRQAVASLGDTVREHPVALGAGIIAIGLALLARNRLAKATVDLGDDLGAYTDYDDGFGYDDTPLSRLADLDDEPEPARRPLAARAGETVADNPLTSVIVGLVAGAALAALFPSTEAERRVMGEAGGRLGDAARRAMAAAGGGRT
jgi:ElaB/YqjD/DUF883 family membrane-anchored ribosome-binding protein